MVKEQASSGTGSLPDGLQGTPRQSWVTTHGEQPVARWRLPSAMEAPESHRVLLLQPSGLNSYRDFLHTAMASSAAPLERSAAAVGLGLHHIPGCSAGSPLHARARSAPASQRGAQFPPRPLPGPRRAAVRITATVATCDHTARSGCHRKSWCRGVRQPRGAGAARRGAAAGAASGAAGSPQSARLGQHVRPDSAPVGRLVVEVQGRKEGGAGAGGGPEDQGHGCVHVSRGARVRYGYALVPGAHPAAVGYVGEWPSLLYTQPNVMRDKVLNESGVNQRVLIGSMTATLGREPRRAPGGMIGSGCP